MTGELRISAHVFARTEARISARLADVTRSTALIEKDMALRRWLEDRGRCIDV